jgi:hypothetical protein
VLMGDIFLHSSVMSCFYWLLTLIHNTE